jgi:hypothetical protein
MNRTRSRSAGVRRTSAVCIAATLLLVAGGCHRALVGQWRLVDASPGRDVFAIDNAEFTPGSGFAATITIAGRTAEETGTYKFNGWKLTLYPVAGGQREYTASLVADSLELSDGDRHVVLQKKKGT